MCRRQNEFFKSNFKCNLFLQNAHNLFDVGAFSGVQQSQVDYSIADCELENKTKNLNWLRDDFIITYKPEILSICFVPSKKKKIIK